MKLVKKEDIAKVTKLDRLGMPYLVKILMQVTKLSKINSLYERNYNNTGLDFIDALFKDLELEYDYFEEELANIPKTGPFVTVSNHPLGGIDGLILIKLISLKRPDFKVMANFLLQKIDPIKDYFMPVNPFENHQDTKSNLNGIKESIAFIKDGHGLGIFPAGEVSSLDIESGRIRDKEWQDGAMKLISKMGVPVVPIFFKARNSRLFYALSMLSSTLQTAKLPSEIFKQKNKAILVRIGNQINTREIKENRNELSFFLRNRTYRLANTIENESRLKRIRNRFAIQSQNSEEEIISPIKTELLIAEIKKAEERGTLLTELKEYQVFFSKAKHIPNILREIGRLREITFREVGEGTGKPLDLDEFDSIYRHLYLWDKKAQRIVGAYRLGIGNDIYKKHGIRGFYIKTLFKIDEKAHGLFSNSLEMGRAFIVSDYQQKPFPLHMLWKGITHVVLRKRKKIRFLIGCVSISNHYSKYAKSIMIEFVKKHFFDQDLARHVQARKEYKVKLGPLEKALVDSTSPEDLNKFDKYINDIEPGNMRFPVLLKKYIKQNAKVVAFNVDPKFNNAVDGLMYIDINDLPEQTIKPVLEELEQATKQQN